MPGENSFNNSLAEDTAEAVKMLGELEDETTPPEVAEFAHFLSQRLNPNLVPIGFVMASQLAIYDLEKGVDGFTGEPIQLSISLADKELYAKLTQAVPELAKKAFSPEFASEVERHLRELGIIVPQESKPGKDLEDGELIVGEIDNIDDAYRKIVVDARERIASLEWDKLEISTDKVYQIYEAVYPLVLRQAPYHMPINILTVSKPEDRRIILDIPPHQKREMIDGYYLALTMQSIPGEYATLTRDHLFLKIPELIARINGIDPNEAIEKIAETGIDTRNPFARAAIRLATFIEDHPDILR